MIIEIHKWHQKKNSKNSTKYKILTENKKITKLTEKIQNTKIRNTTKLTEKKKTQITKKVQLNFQILKPKGLANEMSKNLKLWNYYH